MKKKIWNEKEGNLAGMEKSKVRCDGEETVSKDSLKSSDHQADDRKTSLNLESIMLPLAGILRDFESDPEAVFRRLLQILARSQFFTAGSYPAIRYLNQNYQICEETDSKILATSPFWIKGKKVGEFCLLKTNSSDSREVELTPAEQDLSETFARILADFLEVRFVLKKIENSKDRLQLLAALNKLPDFTALREFCQLIAVPAATEQEILRMMIEIYLFISQRYADIAANKKCCNRSRTDFRQKLKDDHWSWRLEASRFLARKLAADKLGVKALYVFGSVKNAAAGPASDIDLLVHFTGEEIQRERLNNWFEGWSLCLDYFNYLKTGCETGGLLDVHIITNDDIASRDSYAVKIGAVSDAARELELTK